MILIGDAGVRQSCLISRAVTDKFDKTIQSTIGANLHSKPVEHDGGY